MTAEPVVAHVDLDAFFASVEQLRDPRLRGKPVIVGNGVIASCSYEARRHGCYAGQSLREALQMCPAAVILDGCEAVYKAFAQKTFALCAGFSPVMETFLDEAVLDLSGCRRLYSDMEGQARRLQTRILSEIGLPVTLGLGPNRMLAKIAGKSVKPFGLRWIRQSQVESVLPELPIHRLPGVGRAVGRELARYNVCTVGDLRAFPADLLRQLFGAQGAQLHERCHGRDTRPVHAREIPLTISRETAFHRPTIDAAEVESMLYYLTERAVRYARERDLACRTVRVWIDYVEAGRAAASASAAFPTDQDAEVFRLARELLRRQFARREALRRVGVCLSKLSPQSGLQSTLFDARGEARRQRLYQTLDVLRSRYGHAAVVAGPSVRLLGRMQQDRNGFVLRTPSLTK